MTRKFGFAYVCVLPFPNERVPFQEALIASLDQLHVGDRFNIIAFDHTIRIFHHNWSLVVETLEDGTPLRAAVEEAKQWARENVQAQGGNLNCYIEL